MVPFGHNWHLQLFHMNWWMSHYNLCWPVKRNNWDASHLPETAGHRRQLQTYCLFPTVPVRTSPALAFYQRYTRHMPNTHTRPDVHTSHPWHHLISSWSNQSEVLYVVFTGFTGHCNLYCLHWWDRWSAHSLDALLLSIITQCALISYETHRETGHNDTSYSPADHTFPVLQNSGKLPIIGDY